MATPTQRSLIEEYGDLLKKFEIDYDERVCV
jgi:hypothetical protein